MTSAHLIGLLPGTFDPLTQGHLDIIIRATKVVDELVIGVAKDTGKDIFFSDAERLAHTQAALEEVLPLCNPNCTIKVQLFSGLLIQFAQNLNARVIVRGLRAVSDFEYEFQMAGMNGYLSPAIETIFLMSSDKHQFISSRFVKEIARLGGDVSAFVPKCILKALEEKYRG